MAGWRSSRTPRMCLAGAALGVFGVTAFGIAHAVLIVPIWDRLLHGLPFSAAAGIAMAWAFDECGRMQRLPGVRFGAAFGALLWVSLIPMNFLALLLRLWGVRAALGNWEMAIEIAAVFASGVACGWMVSRDRRAAFAMGMALVALTLAMAGPVPVAKSPRAAGLFAAFLPICVGAGVILAALLRATCSPGASQECSQIPAALSGPPIATE